MEGSTLRRIGVYAHWLDGQHYRALRRRNPDLGDSLQIRLAKLLAVLGTPIILSDVQLVDSPIALQLLSDVGFRAFLQDDPGFLSLAAHTANPSRTDVIRSGFTRMMERGWLSSALPDNPRPLIEMAEAVLSAGNPEPDWGEFVPREIQSVLTAWNDDRTAAVVLEQILRAVAYFAEGPLVLQAGGTPGTYYDILLEAAESSDLGSGDPSYHRAYLERTIHAINAIEDEPDVTARRSRLLASLERHEWTPDAQMVWNTAIQGWNVAVQRTLGVEGSVGNLPISCPAGVYLDPPADAVGKPAAPGEEGDVISSLRTLRIEQDPSLLPWENIRAVVRSTSATRDALRRARLEEVEVEGALRAHVKALAQALAGEPKRILTIPTTCVMSVGGGLIGLAFGGVGSVVGAGAGGLASETILGLIRKGRRWRIASSLRPVTQAIVGPS